MGEQGRRRRILHSVARWLVVGAMAVGPWLFGASEPWAYLGVGSAVLLGFGLWLLDRLAFGGAPLRGGAVAVLMACMAGYVALQALPVSGLPAFLRVQAVGDAHATARRLLGESGDLGLLEEADGAAMTGGGSPVSLAPGETRRALFLWVVYTAAFLVLANTIRRRGHYMVAVGVLAVSGFFIALVGVVHHLTGSYEIYWFHPPRYGGNVFGPFSNRNHFAACINLLFGVVLGLFFFLMRPRRGGMATERWSECVGNMTSREASQLVLAGLAMAIMGGAVLISLSRGAMLSLFIALTAVVLWDGRRRGAPVRRSLLTITALLAAGVIWMGWDPVVSRVMTLGAYFADPAQDYRWAVTGDTLRLFGNAPWTGVGFGAFSHAFPLVQTPPVEWRWLHAHNDWAQLFAEGGLLGVVLFASILFAWCREIRARLATTSLGESRFALGLMVSVAACVIHSFADYSLHKPANALLLAGLGGMLLAVVSLGEGWPMLAAADGTGEGAGRRDDGVWVRRVKGICGRVMVVGALLVVVFLAGYMQQALGNEAAILRFRYLQGTFLKGHHTSDLMPVAHEGILEAMAFSDAAQDNPDALREASAALLGWAGDRRLDGVRRHAAGVLARRCAVAAVAGAPADYLTWLGLARVHAAFQEWDAMEICLERSRELVAPGQKVRLLATP